MRLLIVFIGCLVLIFSCQKQSVENESYSTRSVKVNNCKDLLISGDEFTLCLDSVANDSRCPADVICVWSGVALTKWTINVGDRPQSFMLATIDLHHGGYRRSVEVLGYRIELINLMPYPRHTNPYPYTDYTAEVKVSKL